MRRAITGIDHCVVLVRELDAARAQYQRLGFTVASRGLHPPDQGNRQPHRDARARVRRADGRRHADAFERALAPRARGARRNRRRSRCRRRAPTRPPTEMNADGVALSAPEDFARPVALPDGNPPQAAFRTTQFPPGTAPGFHLFCCEHRTRHTTWLPELLHHANGAVGLEHVLAASENPRSDAAHVGRLFATWPKADGDGACRSRPAIARSAFRP